MVPDGTISLFTVRPSLLVLQAYPAIAPLAFAVPPASIASPAALLYRAGSRKSNDIRRSFMHNRAILLLSLALALFPLATGAQSLGPASPEQVGMSSQRLASSTFR